MFKINDGKGFTITFENGWRVSVQFGIGNYCDHHHRTIPTGDWIGAERQCGAMGSSTAETAVLNPAGEFVQVPDYPGDDVQGYQKPADVLRTMQWAASQPPKEKDHE